MPSDVGSDKAGTNLLAVADGRRTRVAPGGAPFPARCHVIGAQGAGSKPTTAPRLSLWDHSSAPLTPICSPGHLRLGQITPVPDQSMALPPLFIDPPVSIPAATLPLDARRRRLAALYALPVVPSHEVADLLLADVQLRMVDNDPSTLPLHEAQWLHALLASSELGSDGFAAWMESEHSQYASETILAFQMVGAHLAAHLVEQAIQSLPQSLQCKEARLAQSEVTTRWVEGELEQRLFVLDGVYRTWQQHLAPDDAIEGRLVTYARRHRLGLGE